MRKLLVLSRIKILGKSTVVCKLIEPSLSLQECRNFRKLSTFPTDPSSFGSPTPAVTRCTPTTPIVTPSPLYTPLPQATSDDLREAKHSSSLPSFSLFLFSLSLSLSRRWRRNSSYTRGGILRTFEKRSQPALLACYSWNADAVDRRVKILFRRHTCINFAAVAYRRAKKKRVEWGGRKKCCKFEKATWPLESEERFGARVSVGNVVCTAIWNLPPLPSEDLFG